MPYTHSHRLGLFIYMLFSPVVQPEQVLEIELIFFLMGGGGGKGQGFILYKVQYPLLSPLCHSFQVLWLWMCQPAVWTALGGFSVPSEQSKHHTNTAAVSITDYRLDPRHYTQLYNFRVQWNPKGPPSQGWNSRELNQAREGQGVPVGVGVGGGVQTKVTLL